MKYSKALSPQLLRYTKEINVNRSIRHLPNAVNVSYGQVWPNQIIYKFLKRKNVLVSSGAPKDLEDHGNQELFSVNEKKPFTVVD